MCVDSSLLVLMSLEDKLSEQKLVAYEALLKAIKYIH